MRVCIWTMLPNHYQASFFHALRDAGVDVRVCYYDRVNEGRRALGWSTYDTLPDGEMYVSQNAAAFTSIPDWRQRVHVVPGFSIGFTRMLAGHFSAHRTPWVHWSETSRPGLRWWATLPRKRWYAGLVNQSALGAFGIGSVAVEDIVRWGVRRERVAVLPYSSPACDQPPSPDEQTVRFVSDRLAFVYVGALIHRKGIDVLLRAFATLDSVHTESVLILVGKDHSNGAYARQAEALGIRDRVLFRGPLPAETIPAVLAAGSVFVLPSRYDGWGVVLNEAATMGLALIGSHRAGASHHLIQPAENGFHVQAGNVASLSAAMRSYEENPILARRHGEASRRVFADYTPARNAERFMRAIRTWSPNCR